MAAAKARARLWTPSRGAAKCGSTRVVVALFAVLTIGVLLGPLGVLFAAHLSTEPESATAEFALLVRSDRRLRGLGKLLLSALVD